MNKKYELTPEVFIINGRPLYRIIALRDFGDVKTGDVGGFIEFEDNLSHDGKCWVSRNAKLYGRSHIYENAQVSDNARIYGNAKIFGKAQVYGTAIVGGATLIYQDAQVSGCANVCGNSRISGDAYIGGVASIYGHVHLDSGVWIRTIDNNMYLVSTTLRRILVA